MGVRVYIAPYSFDGVSKFKFVVDEKEDVYFMSVESGVIVDMAMIINALKRDKSKEIGDFLREFADSDLFDVDKQGFSGHRRNSWISRVVYGLKDLSRTIVDELF